MKRRNADSGKIRRPVKRNKEGMGSNTLLYFKFLILWAIVITADFLLEFRFEYLWPFWLLLRSVHDSFKYKGLAFSVLFVCIAITSDLVCLFFIPVHWLFFAASTYVWVQYVWHTDKGICLPTIILWILFVYLEACIRWKDNKSIPHLDICRPFAAHCIGYPVVTLGFGFKSYIGYKIRQRKQLEVAKENEFYMQLIQQALPKDEQTRSNSAPTRNPLVHQQDREYNHHSNNNNNVINKELLQTTSTPNISTSTITNNSIHRNAQNNNNSNNCSTSSINSSCNNTSSNKLLNNLTNLITTNGHLIIGNIVSSSSTTNSTANSTTSPASSPPPPSLLAAITSNLNSSNTTSGGTVSSSQTLNGGIGKHKKGSDKEVSNNKCDLNNVNNVKSNNSSYQQNTSQNGTTVAPVVTFSQNGCAKDEHILTSNGPNVSVNSVTTSNNIKDHHHSRNDNKLNNSYTSTTATTENNNLTSSTNNNNKISLNNSNNNNQDHNNCDRDKNSTKILNGHLLNNSNTNILHDNGEAQDSQHKQQRDNQNSLNTGSSCTETSSMTSPNISNSSNTSNIGTETSEINTTEKVKNKRNRYKQKDTNTKDNQNHHNHNSTPQQSLNNNTHDNTINSHTREASLNCDTCLRHESDQKKLKQEISNLKTSETELKQRIEVNLSLKSSLQSKQKEIEDLHNKIHEFTNTRQVEKQNYQSLERRLNEERRLRQSLEAQLHNERKHRKQLEDKTARNECAESCKLRKQQLENEVKKIHRELLSCEDINRNMENKNRKYEQELRKFEADLIAREAQQGVEVLMVAIQSLQEKNSTLEKNLSAETRVKLDLFSALGEAKRQVEIKDNTLRANHKEISELKAKVAQFFAVMPPMLNDCLTNVLNESSQSSQLLTTQSQSQKQQQMAQQQQMTQQHHQLNSDCCQPASPMSHTLRLLTTSPLLNIQMNNLGVLTTTPSSSSNCPYNNLMSHQQYTQQQQQQQQQSQLQLQQQQQQINPNSVLDPNATVYTPKSSSTNGGPVET